MPHSKKSRVAVNTKLLQEAMRAAKNQNKNKVAAEAVESYIRVKQHTSPKPTRPSSKMRANQI